VTVREIRPDDVPKVVALVHELAEYERAASLCDLRDHQLHAALFSDAPALFGHVAIDPAGEVVGCALWFLNFSTWHGTHGVYLEDLFVRPSARGHGLGRKLLTTLAEICVERGYRRLEWAVLDWNSPAIGFYESLGAEPMDEWTVYRLAGEALAQLGRSSAGDPERVGPRTPKP
jgi:GNAT superfamily N-acetyltransferase